MARQTNLARKRESEMGPSGIAAATAATGDLQAPGGAAGSGERRPLELDRLIHEHVRLGIVSALAANDSLSFNDLKKLLAATDGNLSVHARKLEEAGYVTCSKFFDKRVPKTEYRLTATGRNALERYLNHMEALIRAMRER